MKNLLLISIDDLFNHVKYRHAFGVELLTPNLDRLAERGTFFEAAYATTPLCNPSRAAIVTGRSAFETGVFTNRETFYDFLSPGETMFGAYQAAGYRTSLMGKLLHANYLKPDFAAGTIDDNLRAQGLFAETHGHPWGAGPAPVGTRDAQFFDHDVATRAIQLLDLHASLRGDPAPFMITAGFFPPHYPFVVPEKYFEPYPLDRIQVAGIPPDPDGTLPDFARQFLRDNDPPDYTAQRIQAYLASISFMDAQLGRVLDAMDAGRHWADTTVALFSDHGYMLGDRDYWGKFTLWEEAANAPLIIVDPDQAGAGRVVREPVSLGALYPTLAALSGLPAPTGVSARSFAGLVDPDLPAPPGGPVLTVIGGSIGMRHGDHRLIRYEDGSVELYDLAADPRQTVNLAADPAHAALLEAELRALGESARHQRIWLLEDPPLRAFGEGDHRIVAGDGAGTLMGGAGDDIYFVGGTTLVVERPGAGEDHAVVRPLAGEDAIDAVAPRWVEHLTTGIGAGHARLTGNALGNRIASGEFGPLEGFGVGGGDTLYGSDGRDLLAGNHGDDRLIGSANADTLLGGAGDDRLIGGAGENRLLAGSGTDILQGMSGADIFAFRPSEALNWIAGISVTDPDRIVARDFDPAEDRIRLMGFGIEDAEAALGFLSDGLHGAEFLAEGTRIKFYGVASAELSASNFIVTGAEDGATPAASMDDPLL